MKWLGIIGLLVFVPNAQAAVIYSEGFEEGKVIEKRLKDNKDGEVKISCDNWSERFSIQDKVKRHGKYAAYLTNKGSERRCELVSKTPESGHYEWGKEYWVGFSFNIPYVEKNALNVYYQHHSALSPAGLKENCQYTGNGFTIRRRGKTDKNEMVVSLRPAKSLNVGGGNAAHGTEEVYSWPMKLNAWEDFVLNFRYSDKNDGFFKVWHNGKLIVDQRGGSNVTLRDSVYSVKHPRERSIGNCGNPMKRKYTQSGGIYGGYEFGGAIYYDELRVGDANSSYEEVAPANGRSVSNFVSKNTPYRAQSSPSTPLTVPKGLELEIK